jgi:arabinosaccharide transport system substrate-binding protein
MAIAAMLTGTAVIIHPKPARTDLVVWTFSGDRGYELEPQILQRFRDDTGKSVGITLMLQRALDTRLISLFMKQNGDAQSPDVVEVEISSVGKFFRPPVDQIGFLPWNDYLRRTGLIEEFSAARMAVWSKDGQIFGLPQDIHPVSLTYRKDLYDEAGIDPSTAHTWPALQADCIAFDRYWHGHGQPQYHAMELASHTTDQLDLMLQQRGISLLDGDNHVHVADPRVAETIAFYTSMVTGPRAMSADANPGGQRWADDVVKGDICMLCTPDWRASELKQDESDQLQGKLAMMPLPMFQAGEDDAPTASWGGTMMAIPRSCKHPEEAQKLALYLTTDPEALKANRLVDFDLIPPLPGRWRDPFYHRPDPFYFGSQSVDDLYVRLAKQLPRRYVTPFTSVAAIELAQVLSSAVAWRRDHGEDGLLEHCQQWLNDTASDLEKRIEFGTFEK